MLSLLSGRWHAVYTGVAIWDRRQDRMYTAFAKTKVFLRKLSRLEILHYFHRVNPFDKAGSYAIQEPPNIVVKIKGSYSNIVGLPLETVKMLLAKLKSGAERKR